MLPLDIPAPKVTTHQHIFLLSDLVVRLQDHVTG